MNIFNYTTLSDYLSAHFKLKKQTNPQFSLQLWCRKIGISSTSALSHMISGKRSIPAKFVPRFIEDLNLADQEARYFMELYFDEKSNHSNQWLSKLNPFNWKVKQVVKDRSFLLNPLSFALVVLKQRNLLKAYDFKTLRSVLHSDILDSDIQSLIDNFSFSDEIDFDRLVNQIDTEDVDVQKVHQFYLNLASKRIESTSIQEKEYNSYSVNIKREDIPKMQKEIRYFLDSLIEKYDDDNNCNMTAQLGTYLYPLTEEKQ